MKSSHAEQQPSNGPDAYRSPTRQTLRAIVNLLNILPKREMSEEEKIPGCEEIQRLAPHRTDIDALPQNTAINEIEADFCDGLVSLADIRIHQQTFNELVSYRYEVIVAEKDREEGDATITRSLILGSSVMKLLDQIPVDADQEERLKLIRELSVPLWRAKLQEEQLGVSELEARELLATLLFSLPLKYAA